VESLLELRSESDVSPIGLDNTEIKEKVGKDATWCYHRSQLEANVAIFCSGCAWKIVVLIDKGNLGLVSALFSVHLECFWSW